MEADGRPHHSREQTSDAVECFHYAVNLPRNVVITGCDPLPILRQALDAARRFQLIASSRVAALLAKAAQAGQLELDKTSHQLDGAYAKQQWLG